jgi:hypothetical protein
MYAEEPPFPFACLGVIYTSVLDRQRFRQFNVICMYSIACIGRKRGKGGHALGLGRDLKMGQLTLDKGPARMGICNHSREVAIPSKGSFPA